MLLRFESYALHRDRAELVAVAPQRRAHETSFDIAGADSLEVTVNQHGVAWADKVDVSRGDGVGHGQWS